MQTLVLSGPNRMRFSSKQFFLLTKKNKNPDDVLIETHFMLIKSSFEKLSCLVKWRDHVSDVSDNKGLPWLKIEDM